MFCKKRFLRTFAKFTGKHLWQSLFFDKVAVVSQQDSDSNVFLWILWNFQQHHFLQNTSGGCLCIYNFAPNEVQVTLRKISKFHLISCVGNFVETPKLCFGQNVRFHQLVKLVKKVKLRHFTQCKLEGIKLIFWQ